MGKIKELLSDSWKTKIEPIGRECGFGKSQDNKFKK